MEKDYAILLKQAKNKLDKSFALVAASVENLAAYDMHKVYTPKQLEPYDALSDRFIRCVEVFVQYFKTYEYYHYAVVSDTFRDGLNKMAKLGLITEVILWMKMRDVRNKIVHDYLPEQTKAMHDSIMNEFFCELSKTKEKIDRIVIESGA